MTPLGMSALTPSSYSWAWGKKKSIFLKWFKLKKRLTNGVFNGMVHCVMWGSRSHACCWSERERCSADPPPHPVWLACLVLTFWDSQEALHTHGECFGCPQPPVRSRTNPCSGSSAGIFDSYMCLQDAPMRQPLTQCPPPLFCLKSSGHMEEESSQCVTQKNGEKLKRTSLNEHGVLSLLSTTQNKTLFERFPLLWEDISLIQTGLSVSADTSSFLQRDIEALLSTCDEKEAWCKETSESVQKLLSQTCCDFQTMKATRLLLLEDVKNIDTSLGSVRSDYSHRLEQLEALQQKLKSEQLFLNPAGARSSFWRRCFCGAEQCSQD